MERKTYHVIPTGDGKWQVKAEGADRAWRLHDTRENAVNEALNLARAVGRGQVLVHDRIEDPAPSASPAEPPA